MKEQSVIHNTFAIERGYPVTPKQVFEAFSDPAKKRRWHAEGANHDIEEFGMEFRAGGREHASYRFKELLPAGKGTDLIFTHQEAFFEGSGGPEMREEGWRKLLEKPDAELAH